MGAEPKTDEGRDGNDGLYMPPTDTFSDFMLREKSRACKQKFKTCLDVPNLAHEDWLEQRSAEFNWWTSGLNADKSGPGSLDARLRLRPDVTAVIIDALEGLDDALSTYYDLATSEPPLADEEDPSGLIEDDDDSTTLDDAHRAPSPWSDMSSGSSQNPTSAVGNGEEDIEETEDAESQGEDVQSPSSSDMFAEQQVYIENNLEVLIRIHTAIKRSGLKLRNKRADDALRESEKEYERQKLTLGAHKALEGKDGEHERFRRYLTKLVLRNGYTEDLMRRLSFRINQIAATERPQDVVKTGDSEDPQGKLKESHAVLLQKKILIVVRAYLYDSARLTTVQRRLIDANIVRRNRMVHAGSASKTPSHVPQWQSQPAARIKPLDKSIEQQGSSITGIFAPTSSRVVPSPALQPVPQSKQSSQATTGFVAQPATALESKFSITGALKPALRSAARSAGTKMSARVGHLDYPSCSGKGAGPFPCDYCPMILPEQYKKKEKWRGHVAQDLCGYVCVFEDCESPEDMFASTYEWMSHMARFHSEAEWVCPLCAKRRFPNDADDAQTVSFAEPSQLEEHILASHPATDLTELDLVVSAGQRAVGIRKVRCPLCRPGLVTSEEDSDDYAVSPHPVGEEAGLVQLEGDQHVATHIHEFALHAFPSPDGEQLSDEARESVPSQPSTRVEIKFEGPRHPEDSTHGTEFAFTLDDMIDLMTDLCTKLIWLCESIQTNVMTGLRLGNINLTLMDLFHAVREVQKAQPEGVVDLDGFVRSLSDALALASQLPDISAASDWEDPQVGELVEDLANTVKELSDLVEAGRRREEANLPSRHEEQGPLSEAQHALKGDTFKQQMNTTSNPTPEFVSDLGSSSQTRGRILVAVDFGTTSSVVAWTRVRAASATRSLKDERIGRPITTRERRKIWLRAALSSPDTRARDQLMHLIDRWPHRAERISKVPTVLQKGDDDNMRWGFECNKDEARYQWFKLELDPRYKAEQLERAYPPLTIKPENAKHAEKLTTQYLQLLRDHVEKIIRESLDNGGRKKSTLLEDVPLEYIITAPAMWPESAQSIIEQCARDAGMAVHRPVKIFVETEAAGIYALDQMHREQGLDVGDTFLICDAGGVIVDLISYTVTQVEPSLVLEEAAAGTGGLCGSSFLDREFLRWLESHVSNCKQWTQWHTENAMDDWRNVLKEVFGIARDRINVIFCPGVDDDPSLNIKNETLQISTSSMKKIFAPVINQILELVDDQIQRVKADNPYRQVNTILLAGGFGENAYLEECIQAAVGETVRVRRMPDCSAAIVKGALIRGLEEKQSSTAEIPTITVGSRMTRRHYGTEALQKYSPGLHDPRQPRHPGGVDGGERIVVMRWFVKKNTRVKESEPMIFPFYYDQRVDFAEWNGHLDSIGLPIYVCEKDTAPEYPDPELIERLVVIKPDLDRIPRETLDKQKGDDGKWYYKIDFQIIMLWNLANVTFKLVHDDTEYGTVDADWDTT